MKNTFDKINSHKLNSDLAHSNTTIVGEKVLLEKAFPWLLFIAKLTLVTALVYFFRIEADLGFQRFWYTITGAFVVHSLSPKKFRPYIFLTTFLLILGLFLGLIGGLKILFMGLLLLGICHLPVPLQLRKIIVFLIGIVLALMVFEVIPSPISTQQMRVFATIFMFRVILYLHELKYEKNTISVITRLNYFFLFPNVIFPLFPIVDYKGFQKSYYNEEDISIYHKGINLIIYSTFCLLLYRLVYYYGKPSLREISSLYEVLFYHLGTYLTVIRLIGLLCLSVGILRLFGYNLPRIFNNMFLANSFSDIFRRINIYWKEFLTKVVYYPVYFKLRKKVPKNVTTYSIIITYFFTWIFHIYQWFWVLGSNPIRENSIIFWGVFGVFATINSLFENKSAKNENEWSFKYALIHVGKVLLTFFGMSLLYTMWVSPTFNNWVGLLEIGLRDDLQSWVVFIGIALSIWLFIGAGFWLYKKSNQSKINWSVDSMHTSFILSIILVLVTSIVYYYKEDSESVYLFKENLALNEVDDIEEFAGYYSEILSVRPDVGSKLWGYDRVVQKKKENFRDKDFVRPVKNVLQHEFIPNTKGTYKGKEISANQWGFRDKEYSKKPAEGTIRIAIVGASPTMGSGVNDSEVFEQLVENWLNENYGSDTLRFELLNFAQPSMAIFHHAFMLENKIKFFEPDYILDIEHCRPFLGNIRKWQRVLDTKVPVYPELDSMIKANEIQTWKLKTDADKEVKGKLFADFGFKYFVKLCKKYDIKPIWTFLPAVGKANFLADYLPIAKDAGFKDFILLKDVYVNYNQKLLEVSAGDHHPNALGHQVIAKALYKELEKYLGLSSEKKKIEE